MAYWPCCYPIEEEKKDKPQNQELLQLLYLDYEHSKDTYQNPAQKHALKITGNNPPTSQPYHGLSTKKAVFLSFSYLHVFSHMDEYPFVPLLPIPYSNWVNV